MCLEIWAFSGAALLAGWLGAVSLAAHTVALNMAALAFMVPLGISQGAVTRVGNLLGAGRHREAQRASWVALVMGAGVMTISACAFVWLRELLPTVYTADARVIALCASILPIAAAFQLFDGTQIIATGALRGLKDTRVPLLYAVVAYWPIGFGTSVLLGFQLGLGGLGIWIGLAFGLATLSALGIWRFHRRERLPWAQSLRAVAES